MSDISDFISEQFIFLQPGKLVKISHLPEEYSGYIFKTPEKVGVAVEFPSVSEVFEEAGGCSIESEDLVIENRKSRYLCLSSDKAENYPEFSHICADFVRTDNQGTERNRLISNPLDWWEKWLELLGNNIKEKSVSSLIGELYTLRMLDDSGYKGLWCGPDGGSHDIKCRDFDVEVKTTTSKYGSMITVTGQHQLKHSGKLYLILIRLEKDKNGELSALSLYNQLVQRGFDSEALMKAIHKLGFDSREKIFREKYTLLEEKKYLVDDSFPAITDDSFKCGKVPEGILRVTYVVDLDSVRQVPDFEGNRNV